MAESSKPAPHWDRSSDRLQDMPRCCQAKGHELAAGVESAARLNANLTALIENTDQFILFSDANGMPLVYNQAYARAIKELLGIEMRPGLQPHTFLPDEQRRYWESLHRRVLSGEKFSAEYSYTPPGSETRHFEVWFNPVVENGEIIGFSEFSREITEQKKVEQERRLRQQHLDMAVEEERRRIAGDLHDSLGQELFSLQLAIAATADSLADLDADEAGRALQNHAGACRKLVADIRAICHDLYPATLTSLGLTASLRELARRCENDSIDVELLADDHLDDRSIRPQLAIAVYRIAQEATDNALRHSGASKIELRLSAKDGHLTLSVADNGKGFGSAHDADGLGLEQMTGRAETFGGELIIETSPAGTTIRACLPLTDRA